MLREVSDEPLDRDRGTERRDRDADDDRQHAAEILDEARRAAFMSQDRLRGLVDTRAAERGKPEQKRELRGVLGSQPRDHATHDRHHRAARARPHRDRLQESDNECPLPRHRFDRTAVLRRVDRRGAIVLGSARHRRIGLLVSRSAKPRSDADQQHAAEAERRKHRDRPKEMRLDEVVEKHPEHRRRQERDEEIDQEPQSCGILPEEAADHREDPHAIEPKHREDRAPLDDDVERVDRLLRRRVAIEAEQPRGQDEVPGARDRQVFGDPFDDPEDRRIEDGHRGGSLEDRSRISPRGAPSIGSRRPDR